MYVFALVQQNINHNTSLCFNKQAKLPYEHCLTVKIQWDEIHNFAHQSTSPTLPLTNHIHFK